MSGKYRLAGLVSVLGLSAAAMAQPANNNCVDAIAIIIGQPYSGSTVTATNDGNGGCGTTTGSKDVWYKYTATADKLLVVDNCAAGNYDSVFSIHSGCPGNTGNVLACNDDSCGTRSRVQWSVTTGNTYYIRVGGYNGASGTFTLNASLQDPPPPPTVGPDVYVVALHDIGIYTANSGITPYAVGTTSCNQGDAPVMWTQNTNAHPVIGQNMYRIKNGVFEQIGQSWLKHGFVSVNGNCTTCITPPQGGGALGIGCNDPYGAGLNGGQGGLGPRSEVNPTTGVYPYPFGGQSAVTSIDKRLQVKTTDVTPALNTGAQYLVEGQYITADDAQWNNGLNNASYRRINIASQTAVPTFNGGTVVQRTAIEGWATIDPTVTVTAIDYDDRGIVSRFWLGCKVIDNGDGTWKYVYVLFNLNSNRAARSISIPHQPGVAFTSSTFSSPASHTGEPFENTPWSFNGSGSAWAQWSTDTFAVKANANAVRWGTASTFTVIANTGPTSGQAKIGLFKPGAVGAVNELTANVRVPSAGSCVADFNRDGTVDLFDYDAFVECFDAENCLEGINSDFNNDGASDFFDFDDFVVSFETPC
ncbi:MAG: hypothetical protein AABZ53_01560 [Planctomycetota bacterium]